MYNFHEFIRIYCITCSKDAKINTAEEDENEVRKKKEINGQQCRDRKGRSKGIEGSTVAHAFSGTSVHRATKKKRNCVQ